MEKKISNNQACLLACLFILALKLSALPAIMFTIAGNDSYVACFFALIIDFIGTVILVEIMTKIPNLTFFELIKETLGKVMEKIVAIILFVYFILKCVLTLQELHDYFITTLFDDLKPLPFFIIITLFIFFVTTKDFRTMGRVLQLTFWPIIICILFTLIFPLGDIQLDRMLPIYEQGLYPIMQAIFRPMFAFGDYIIILMLMGRVEDKPGLKKSLLKFILVSFLFILMFFIIFVGSFGNFAMNQTLALGELPLHSTTPSTIGKLEWLTVVVWTGILLLNAGLLSINCRVCFDNIFGTHAKNISSTVITAIIVLVLVATYLQLDKLLLFLISTTCAIISTSIQLLLLGLAILCAIIYLKKNRKNNISQNKNDIPKSKKESSIVPRNSTKKSKKRMVSSSAKPNA